MLIDGVPNDKEFLYSLREMLVNYGEDPESEHINRLDVIIGSTDPQALCT